MIRLTAKGNMKNASTPAFVLENAVCSLQKKHTVETAKGQRERRAFVNTRGELLTPKNRNVIIRETNVCEATVAVSRIHEKVQRKVNDEQCPVLQEPVVGTTIKQKTVKKDQKLEI